MDRVCVCQVDVIKPCSVGCFVDFPRWSNVGCGGGHSLVRSGEKFTFSLEPEMQLVTVMIFSCMKQARGFRNIDLC
jgi:hypothetical protein